MKKYTLPALLFLFLAASAAPACSQKSGCPAQDSLRPKVTKSGELKKTGGGKSGLFPKKMTKRMR